MNKAEQGQSFLDMVLQMTGSIDNAVEMAVANGVQLTEIISAGQVLSGTPITDSAAAGYWNQTRKPATALPLLVMDEQNEFFPGLPGMLPLMLA